MTDQPDQKTKEAWHADPKNWKLGIFYYNPDDKRILPPKRIEWMGWTVNFANPWSVAIFLAMLLTGIALILI